MAEHTVHLLGPVQVKWKTGQPPRFRSDRTKALLGYLVAERRPLTRDFLAALFWPDEPLAAGRGKLRREIHNLGNLLPGCWQINRKIVAFSSDEGTIVDLDMLLQLSAEEAWTAAAELLPGTFLEGVVLENNLEFETWLAGERERWQQLAEQVFLQASRVEGEQGNYSKVRRYLTRLLRLAPWHEEGHRRMMRLLAYSGQFSAALKQYEQCKDILSEQLDVPPSETTTALLERIKLARTMPAHNLPPQSTPFIGREEELLDLRQWLADPACRLITLTGVGGIGKSRLALEVARTIATEDFRLFLHGVAYVPLAGVVAEDLIDAVGASLGLGYSGQQPAERQLLDYLGELEMLLLLDNFEHLLPRTSMLARILEQAPEIKLLVTSRERLHLKEEWLFELEGLPYPERDLVENAEGTGTKPEAAAVRLFSACARRVQHTFSLETSDREVAAICRLVQGMPLALELSAARLNSLAPAAVLRELERGLDILSTETRDASSGHSSLRATFDISWTALSSKEKNALASLSLFRGPFTRRAASLVAGAGPSIMDGLVNKSLVRLTPSGRYEMHELLRQYAAEKLAAEPEVETKAWNRFMDYYATFLVEREQRLLETDQEAALEEIDQEIDNIKTAWRWLVRSEKLALLDRALWTLFSFYLFRGHAVEGLALADFALDHISQSGERDLQIRRLQSRLLLFRGFFIYWSGRLVEARRLLVRVLGQLQNVGSSQDLGLVYFTLGQTFLELGESGALTFLEEGYAIVRSSGPRWLECLLAFRLAFLISFEIGTKAYERADRLALEASQISRQLDNPFLLSYAFYTKANLAAYRDNYRRAENLYKRALAAARRTDDHWMMGIILQNLGHLNYLCASYEEARKLYFDSRLHYRRKGSRRYEARLYNKLGELSRAEGTLEQAAAMYGKCITLHEELGNIEHTYWASCNLGHVYLQQSELEAALDCFVHAISGLEDSEDAMLVAMILTGMAGALLVIEKPEDAARTAGAAKTAMMAMTRRLEMADRQDWERILTAIKTKLDDERFSRSWENGREMPPDLALAHALHEVGKEPPSWLT